MSAAEDTRPDPPPGGSPPLDLTAAELVTLVGLLALYHATAPADDLEAIEAVSRSVNRRLFDLGPGHDPGAGWYCYGGRWQHEDPDAPDLEP